MLYELSPRLYKPFRGDADVGPSEPFSKVQANPLPLLAFSIWYVFRLPFWHIFWPPFWPFSSHWLCFLVRRVPSCYLGHQQRSLWQISGALSDILNLFKSFYLAVLSKISFDIPSGICSQILLVFNLAYLLTFFLANPLAAFFLVYLIFWHSFRRIFWHVF